MASGNDFVASLEAEVQGTADRTDRVEDTVDYAALAGLVLEVSASRQYSTVEALAAACAESALERFPAITAVTVTLDKLAPPMDAKAESCGVRLRRQR
jgi:dihydroneopterin aldolase